MSGTTIVVAGGPQSGPLPAAFSTFDRCIAADSGADYCRAHGVRVDHLVGDLDSISDTALAQLEAEGIAIDRHPADKDQTDLELALQLADQAQPDRLLVTGIGGGRLDHLLANMATVASRAIPGRPVEAAVGDDRFVAFCDRVVLQGFVGQTVSLLPILGSVEGVVTTGLDFPLRDEPLMVGTARGMSNRFAEPEATIQVRSGTLLAVWTASESDGGDLS